mmetsp:Transcript_7085/g.14760  ORF Transcript_7085/g.14760 Transcript_7085/m.14760 type:complete len:396 (-) Transcript_7085:147-1334(-)
MPRRYAPLRCCLMALVISNISASSPNLRGLSGGVCPDGEDVDRSLRLVATCYGSDSSVKVDTELPKSLIRGDLSELITDDVPSLRFESFTKYGCTRQGGSYETLNCGEAESYYDDVPLYLFDVCCVGRNVISAAPTHLSPTSTMSLAALASGLCGDLGIKADVYAGFSCMNGAMSVGDSNFGMTEGACVWGEWTEYTCEEALVVYAAGGISWEFAVAYEKTWGPKCCDGFMVRNICGTREVIVPSNTAGSSCVDTDGTAMGDSVLSFTWKDCRTVGGTWLRYTCGEANQAWLLQGGERWQDGELFIRPAWALKCCLIDVADTNAPTAVPASDDEAALTSPPTMMVTPRPTATSTTPDPTTTPTSRATASTTTVEPTAAPTASPNLNDIWGEIDAA